MKKRVSLSNNEVHFQMKENFIDYNINKKTFLNAESIPTELKECSQWVLCKLEQRDGRTTKVPYNVNGYRADVTDSKMWTNFEEALETYQTNTEAYSGLGFVFTEEDPFIFIDWDHARDPRTGEFYPDVIEEVTSTGSYAEISQSGNGFHVIAVGTSPGPRKRGNDREIYPSKRFVAITGDHVKSTPCTVNKAPEDAIRTIYDRMVGSVKDASKNETSANEQARKPERNTKPGMPDFDVLGKCRSGKSADRFNTLYSGNWDVLGCYPSQSEADLALCSMFAAHTQDRSQIERLFAGSGLCSDKWNRADYKESTIRKALERTNEDPYRKYFSERQFIAKSLADEIMKEYYFLTFDDNKEVYYYKNGVYLPGGENLIAQVAQAKLGKYSTKNRREETLSFIRIETLTDRNSIDKEKYIINLKNGLYDLKKDKFKPHTPKLLSTVQIPVNYDPDAECPMIDKFLSEIVSDEYIPMLLEWIGYSMIPDNSMQKSVMLVGGGSNGKSVFLNLQTEYIGINNTSGESLQNLEKDRFSAANLYGKLLNVCPDIAGSEVYDSSAFKMMTGNEKQIRGEKKGQQAFYFDNTARLIFSANDVPPVKNAGYSYYRRWILIEFPNKFEGKNADKNLIDKLTTEKELSGLLNKAIEALKRLLENGEFSYHKTIEEVQYMYQLKSSPVAVFAAECVKTSKEDTRKNLVYDAYVNWCTENGEKPISDNKFGEQFKKLGYHSIREPTGERKYCWESVSIDTSKL